jgi:hypothetical protein
MKILILITLVVSPSLHAQSFIQNIESINQNLGQSAVDNYLQSPGPEGVPGSFISSLAPTNSSDICVNPQGPKNTHYEIILIGKQEPKHNGTQGTSVINRELKTLELQSLAIDVPFRMESFGLKPEAILERAKDFWASGKITTPTIDFDPYSNLGRELFLESIVQAAGKSSLDEKTLSKNIAAIISGVYKTEDQKILLLRGLSDRLYRNYNNARNPGYNIPRHNPFNAELPAGDITVNQMLKASGEFDVFNGGVCNDISETVAMIGEHLLPDKDVLTINSGSHFGVVISDGKRHQIIDGARDINLNRKLQLDPLLSSTNLRISKVENGALKEIAVVDTELGQFTEAAFQTGKKLLKTDADISSLILQYKKDHLNLAVGQGVLSDSNVFIVVAKYQTSADKWKAHIGVGGTLHHFDNGQQAKFQVHLKSGVERTLFKYVNAQTQVSFATGLQGSGMATVFGKSEALKEKEDFSVGLDWINRLEVQYGKADSKGVQVRAVLETENSLGPTNWGNTSGALSYMTASDSKAILKNMTFHLNQVNAEVVASKKLSEKVTGSAKVEYQGSNVGQRVSVLAGIDIKAPEGAQILVFTGYTNAGIKGYKTKHSLLANPTGPEFGVKYISKKGVEIGAGARSISGKPSLNTSIKIPLKNN